MYEILNTFKWKPNPKFNEISSILKNPKNFQKLQILGFKTWNAWMRRIRSLPSEEKLEKPCKILENQDWSVFGRETEKYRERDWWK